jgi:hypothetical protein
MSFPSEGNSTVNVSNLSVDQSNPGTTDSVTVKASAGIGSLTEAAPATDTASSGLNGRLQRVAQRLTSLITLFPSALGQGTMATSFKVVLPSDQSAVPVSQASSVRRVSVAFNRPANMTPYSAGDAIGPVIGSSALTYDVLGTAGKTIRIEGISIRMDALPMTVPIGNISVKLYSLYPSEFLDNNNWGLWAQDRSKWLTEIDVGTPTFRTGDTYWVSASNIGEYITLAETAIYVVLTTDSACTFAENSTTIVVTLYAVDV